MIGLMELVDKILTDRRPVYYSIRFHEPKELRGVCEHKFLTREEARDYLDFIAFTIGEVVTADIYINLDQEGMGHA